LKGRGVQAIYQDKKIYVGSPGLLELLEITLPETLNRFTETANQRGQTVVYLVVEKQAQAAFALADVIRPESREAVGRLQALGVEVAMLTGDSRAVAAAVAKDLGIRQYTAEVLPENKEQEVRKFQEQGKLVAMVGDGVNDAPALVRADVGIAIGSGTDVAVESAGIILVKNNPLDVVRAIELSRASYRKMQQNLFWATGYNLVAIPLAAGLLAPWGVDLTPAVGALLMSLSTVVVAVNAQLLRRLVL
jgi:Cu2+-exporting ATPase